MGPCDVQTRDPTAAVDCNLKTVNTMTAELAKLKNRDSRRDEQGAVVSPDFTASTAKRDLALALLTGGADRPYAFGLATALISRGAALDIIGNDDLDCSEFRGKTGVTFLNLRGNQRSDV